MRNAVALMFAAILLCIAGVSAVRASDTEADAIAAVVAEWAANDDNTATLDALDALYAEASPACQSYIALLFTGISLVDAAQQHSPANQLGLDMGFGLMLQYGEQAEYACRIAI